MRKGLLILSVLLIIVLSTSVVLAAKTNFGINKQITQEIEPDVDEKVKTLPIEPEPIQSVVKEKINTSIKQKIDRKIVPIPLDITFPQWSNELAIPSSPTYYEDGKNYQFSIDWIDDVGITDVNLSFDGINYNYSDGNISKTGDTYYKIFTGLGIGIHYYNWSAHDADGNSNATNNLEYIIKDPAPQLTLNGIQNNLTIWYGIQSTAFATSDIGTVELYRNGTLVNNPEILILGVGVYNYTAYNTLTVKSKTYFLTVSKATPNLELILDNVGGFVNFDTYYYRYKIYKNTLTESAVSANDINGIDGDIIWTKIMNDSYVYSTVSGPSGTITIGNETHEKYWENEIDLTGNSPELIYDSDTVAVWHFGNSSYNTSDSTVNDNDAYWWDITESSDCVFGNCVELDGGVNEEIRFADSSSLDITKNLSICAWINMNTQGASDMIVSKDKNGVSTRGYYLNVASGKLRLYIANTNGANVMHRTSTLNVNSLSWDYVCGVYDSGVPSMTLYQNGVVMAGTTVGATGSIQNTVYDLIIGDDSNGGDGFDGKIDEVRIYNSSLTSTEILDMYYNGINNLTSLGPKETGLVDTIVYPTPSNVTATLDINNNFYLYRNGTEIASGTNLINEFMVLPARAYNYTAYYPGNENYTEIYVTKNLTVEKGTPNLTFNIDPDSPITYGTSNTASCNVSNQQQSPILYRDSVDVTAEENNQPTVLPANEIGYNYTCAVEEMQNYSAAGIQTNYIVNKKIPVLNLDSVPDWIVDYPTETTVTAFEINEGDYDLTYTLYRDMNPVSSPDINTFDFGQYIYTYNASGGQNYTFGGIQKTLEVKDLSIPIVIITNPINDSYTGTSVWLNATTNEDTTCSFGCQSDMGGFGGDPIGPLGTSHSVFLTNLSYGLTTCSINCTDSYNNTGIDSVYWYVVKQYSSQLQPGHNFISVAYKQYDTSLTRVLESIDGKYDYIWYYNATDPADHWKTYATFKPPSLNDLWAIKRTMGFWININESTPVMYTLYGIDESTTQIELKQGSNMVGYPSFTMRTVENALQGLPWTSVEGFDENAEYNLRELAPTELMGPNNGYWINVTEDCTWVVDW